MLGALRESGAYEETLVAAPSRRALVAGVETADSWATDGHKWLNVPYDSGIAFVRNGVALRASMSLSAAYLPDDGRREPFHSTPECSRRARGIELWAALRSLGRSGVAALIEDCCQHASRFAEGLRGAGYDVLNDVVLNQVVVTFGDAPRTQEVIRRIQAEGVCWCGVTHWRGHTAMRISVSNWSTTPADVEASLESILRCASRA